MSLARGSQDRALPAAAALIPVFFAWALAGDARGQETSVADSESGGGLLQIRSLPDPTAPLAPFEGRIVDDLTIVGNNVTKSHVIERELLTRVGAPLRIEAVREELIKLEDLDIFSSVTVTPTETSGGVALEYEVSEMPWIIPYLAFRYTEDDGFSVGPAFSSMNMLGRDIATSGRVLFGGTTTFQLLFSWPWITGNRVSIDVFAAHLTRDDPVRQFGETSTEITPWIGTYLGERGRLKAGFSWFRMESDTAGITLSDSNVDNLFRLGVGAGYDSRDSKRATFHGWDNEIQAFYTGGPLGGDGDFWTVDLDVRRFQPVVEKQTLVLGGLLTLQSGAPGVDIPAGIDRPSYMDYAIGGATTVRGWDNVALGRQLFGKSQLLGTVEYKYLLLPLTEFVILGRWSVSLGAEVAAFADYGIAWSEDAQFNSDRGKTGFGVGFRPLVPTIEALRLDLAVSSEGDVRFHFGVRTKYEAQRLRLR